MAGGITSHTYAEDWGAYSLVPVSAPAMVLEAVDAGTTDGTLVSIGKPAGTPQQKWIMVAKGEDFFTIKPSYSSTLVLAVAKAGTNNGTPIVLETESGSPSQLWQIKKLENGSYNLIPKHAPDKGIDDLGGKQLPGSKIDLRVNNGGDQHLQWQIKPLAGSSVAAATAGGEAAEKGYVGTINQAGRTCCWGGLKPSSSPPAPSSLAPWRDVTVFIPKQYDGSKPACVYVKTDGYNPREKTVMETMIATKEMPVTVGVFVKPGTLPATVKGTMDRRNRCFRIRMVWVTIMCVFLWKNCCPSSRKSTVSTSPPAATTAAFPAAAAAASPPSTAPGSARKPSAACTAPAAVSWRFVAAMSSPTLIRKTEAKPIRAFMTTATHDMENCAGDWFVIDQEIDKAMKFSGYDYVFRIVDGRHVAGYMENYQEAMSYLWERLAGGRQDRTERTACQRFPGCQRGLAAGFRRPSRGPWSGLQCQRRSVLCGIGEQQDHAPGPGGAGEGICG